MTGLVLVAFALGLSNFAAAVGIGMRGVAGRGRVRIGVAFAVFEAGMPLIGLVAGRVAASAVGGAGRYVGAALPAATGIYGVVQARRGGCERSIQARASASSSSLLSR